MEENKVATVDERVRHRFIQIVHGVTCKRPETLCTMDDQKCKRIGDAILQSPSLRVTLVEPRYYVADGRPGYVVLDRDTNLLLAEFVNGGARQQRASEYAAWLNSKEPK